MYLKSRGPSMNYYENDFSTLKYYKPYKEISSCVEINVRNDKISRNTQEAILQIDEVINSLKEIKEFLMVNN